MPASCGLPVTTYVGNRTRFRRAIGVTGQLSAVDGLLTSAENLTLVADLHHLSRAEGRRRSVELLDLLELNESAGKLASTYSGGMKRRLDLAMTLLGRPRVIFLDEEPTTGLDPRSRRTVWQIVRDRVADGVSILLTNQDLDEADQLADRVAVLEPKAGPHSPTPTSSASTRRSTRRRDGISTTLGFPSSPTP
jgi:ABC-2 type transport system ATP-binding protein